MSIEAGAKALYEEVWIKQGQPVPHFFAPEWEDLASDKQDDYRRFAAVVLAAADNSQEAGA